MSTSKLDRLVHYICARCENPSQLGATKLNKVLWYSDVFRYAQVGESITGAVYIKRQFGPVPKDVLAARDRLKKDGCVIEKEALFFGHNQIQFISMKTPDISIFSSDEISLVDTIIQHICGAHTAVSISQASHDVVWEAAEIGEEIPMSAAAFAGNIGELDEKDLSWAKNEVDRIARDSVSTHA